MRVCYGDVECGLLCLIKVCQWSGAIVTFHIALPWSKGAPAQTEKWCDDSIFGAVAAAGGWQIGDQVAKLAADDRWETIAGLNYGRVFLVFFLLPIRRRSRAHVMTTTNDRAISYVCLSLIFRYAAFTIIVYLLWEVKSAGDTGKTQPLGGAAIWANDDRMIGCLNIIITGNSHLSVFPLSFCVLT